MPRLARDVRASQGIRLLAALGALVYGAPPVQRAFFTLVVSGALAAGCGGPQAGPTSYGQRAREDYERAMQAFEANDCLTADPLFQNVRREYPYSRYAALAELRHADCELRQSHYTEAIRAYRSFVRARPTHEDVDTASFSIALAYFRQIPDDFFLSPPPEERDQAATRSALRIVRQFLEDYPDSEHVEEARRIEHRVLELLARHELYVGGWYLQRDNAQATINRLETLLASYEGSGVEPEAMLLLGRTYLHMLEQDEAQRTFSRILDRYPTSGFAEQARRYLVAMGRERIEPDDEGEGEGEEEEEEEEDAEYREAYEEDAADSVEEPSRPDPDEEDEVDEEDGERGDDDDLS